MPLINSIEIFLETSPNFGGTSDSVYLGILTPHAGREFPLRYQKNGTVLESGKPYKFGINSSDPSYQAIWASDPAGINSVQAYPLEVNLGGSSSTRVYIRKEPTRETGQNDDALILIDASVVIRFDIEAFCYRSRYMNNTEPSVIQLSNETGAQTYLYEV